MIGRPDGFWQRLRRSLPAPAPVLEPSEEAMAVGLLRARQAAVYEWARAFVHGRILLDVGTGRGRGIGTLASAAAVTIALDVDAEACRSARDEAGVRAVRADGQSLPFADEVFDVVVAFQVVEHVWDDHRLIRELLRVLRPSGHLLISTPHRRTRLLPFQMPWIEEHIREYSPEDLDRLLQVHTGMVQILALTGSPNASAIERARTFQDPWGHFLPGRFWGPLRRVLRTCDRWLRPPSRPWTTGSNLPGSHAFTISTEGMAEALDVVAVSQKELPQDAPGKQYEPRQYWEDRHRRLTGLCATGTLGAPEAWQHWLYRGKTRALRSLLGRNGLVPLSGPVLDFGCGSGFFEDIWEQWGAPRADGVDIVPEVVERLRVRHPGRRYLACDLGHEPDAIRAWGPYQLVTGIDVFFHTTEDEAVLRVLGALRAAAGPGAWLLVTDRLFDDRPAAHVRFRALNQWRQLLSMSGAEVVDLEPVFVAQNRPNRWSEHVPRLHGAGTLAIDVFARKLFPWAANNRALLARFT